MKKYATVDTAKSTRIFMRAFTWFLRRTVPSSRNAKPACMARTMIAPSRMKRTSEDVFSGSMRPSPFLLFPAGKERPQLVVDEPSCGRHLRSVEHAVEALPLAAGFPEERQRRLDDVLVR